VKRIVLLFGFAWIVIITVLHFWQNLDVKWFQAGDASATGQKFRVGFLPVT